MLLNTVESFLPCFCLVVVVMIIRHFEITEMTGASPGFAKKLLSASNNISFMSVLTSMYDPCAPTLAVVVEERKTLEKEEELNDMREHATRKIQHLYPVMSPAQFNQTVASMFPV